MCLSLLATAAISYGIAYLLSYLFASGSTNIGAIYVGTMVVSIIGLFVMAFILPSKFSNEKHSVLPAYAIFIIFMSVLISSVYLLFDLFILGFTFGITALVFGIMALLGILSKGNMAGSLMLASGLLIGCLILLFVNIFLNSSGIAWIVSFGIFALILLVTMLDVKHIKDVIYLGSRNSYNLVLYGSFILYMDFIDIFIRLLPYIVRIMADSKN